MDSTSIYNALLPHCKPGFEKTLWVYIRFCVERSHPSKTPDCENHHILPKTILPEYKNLSHNPWNKTRLAYRDHFRVHKMLARCIGGKMTQALWFMTNSRWNTGYQVSLQEYEQARKAFSESRKCRKTSQKTRQKQREANKGKVCSPEVRQNMSESQKGRIHPQETRNKISKAKKGTVSPNKGRKIHSEETRKILSEANKGNKNALGWKPSEEYRKRRSESLKGGTQSEESKEKISKKLKGKPKPRVTCQHCGKTGGINQMKRYHFDNCKFKQ